MKNLPTNITTQKNKLSTPGSWLIFIDVAYPSLTASPRTHYRFVNNTADITLGGTTYTKWAFGLGQVRETIKGDLPRVTLSLYDVDLTMRSTLQSNDGWSGGEVSVRKAFVTQAGVATDTNIIQYFTILDTVWDDSRNIINFNLGISTPLNKRFPRDRYVATICRHRFRGGFCRYGEDGEGSLVDNQIALYSAPGAYDYIRVWSYTAWILFDEAQIIAISDSLYNDDKYKVHHVTYGEQTGYGRLYLDTNFRFNQAENSNHARTLTLTTTCDYSLTQCQANNNSHMYGASPGVAGGPYG